MAWFEDCCIPTHPAVLLWRMGNNPSGWGKYLCTLKNSNYFCLNYYLCHKKRFCMFKVKIQPRFAQGTCTVHSTSRWKTQCSSYSFWVYSPIYRMLIAINSCFAQIRCKSAWESTSWLARSLSPVPDFWTFSWGYFYCLCILVSISGHV